jgi:predicted O-linked N-acetylglucosamine transferase (SPINDLY family)
MNPWRAGGSARDRVERARTASPLFDAARYASDFETMLLELASAKISP